MGLGPNERSLPIEAARVGAIPQDFAEELARNAVPAAERYNYVAVPAGGDRYNKAAFGGRVSSAGDGQLVVAG